MTTRGTTPTSLLLISPRDAVRLLGGSVAALVVIATLLGAFRLLSGHDNLLGLMPMFDLTLENNVPTWFSGGLLLAASILLGLIARHGQTAHPALLAGSRPAQWYGLALIFAYLSLDEVAQLHERTTQPTRDLLGVGGVLYWAWVVPALLAALAVGMLYWRFLTRLPARTARGFVIAAVLFVGAPGGGARLGGLIRMADVAAPTARVLNWLVSLVEETLEMSAIVVFIHDLLRHAAGAATTQGTAAGGSPRGGESALRSGQMDPGFGLGTPVGGSATRTAAT